MISSVSCELVQSQTVRLERTSVELGRMMGNIATSGVRMIDSMAAADMTIARSGFRRRVKSTEAIKPMTPKAGTIHSRG